MHTRAFWLENPTSSDLSFAVSSGERSLRIGDSPATSSCLMSAAQPKATKIPSCKTKAEGFRLTTGCSEVCHAQCLCAIHSDDRLNLTANPPLQRHAKPRRDAMSRAAPRKVAPKTHARRTCAHGLFACKLCARGRDAK